MRPPVLFPIFTWQAPPHIKIRSAKVDVFETGLFQRSISPKISIEATRKVSVEYLFKMKFNSMTKNFDLVKPVRMNVKCTKMKPFQIN